jgi:REP element-mobilizing transposase RayT
VTSRGNERKEIFRDDEDRRKFLSVLVDVVELYRWTVHAWVLMGNHYHLLLETPEPTLSRGMRQLNGVYTQAFNRRHRRAGHLLQGRFKAILVERDAHLLELCRYVVLNPVRAGVVTSPRAWPWSSYRATAGFLSPPSWLETDWTLRNFGERGDKAVRAYRRFVSEGMRSATRPWKGVRAQIYLGGDAFLGDVASRAPGIRAGVPRRQQMPVEVDPRRAAERAARALGETLESLDQSPRLRIRERRLVAAALRRYGLVALDRIGAVLGVGLAQASTLALKGDVEISRTPALERKMALAVRGDAR